MSIRFAASRLGDRCALRCIGKAVVRPAANDNLRGLGEDRVLRAALRHFAAHGLGAAEAARAEAEAAFFAGDRTGYAWWLGICRTLDRRMADAVAAHRKAASRA